MPKAKREFDAVTRRIAQNVRHLRDALGLSQERLARLAGTSQGAVSRVESGRAEATPLATYWALLMALLPQLEPVEADLAPDLQTLLAVGRAVLPLGAESFRVFTEPGLGSLLGAYHALVPMDQVAFVRLVVPIAQALRERERIGAAPLPAVVEPDAHAVPPPAPLPPLLSGSLTWSHG